MHVWQSDRIWENYAALGWEAGAAIDRVFMTVQSIVIALGGMIRRKSSRAGIPVVGYAGVDAGIRTGFHPVQWQAEAPVPHLRIRILTAVVALAHEPLDQLAVDSDGGAELANFLQ
jgi:hypothetical protein